MATVKFDEGTKFETSLNLEDDEGVIFVRPPKNLIFKTVGMKYWTLNLVLTNKRLVTIPVPPNKKDWQVESYYYNEMTGAREVKQTSGDEGSMASFAIDMKEGGKSSYVKGGEFTIRMEMGVLNVFKKLAGDVSRGLDKNAGVLNASYRAAFEDGHYTAKSLDKYYAKQNEIAKARAANMDFSNTDHQQLRGYIVDVVNQFVEVVNS